MIPFIFPNFKILSITFITFVLMVLIYISTEIFYAAKVNETGAGSSDYVWNCVLYYTGAKYTYAITRKGHIHRLFLPGILHVSWTHLLSNMLSYLILGFNIEKALIVEGGKFSWKYLILLIAGTFGGFLMSGTLNPYYISVGFSCSLFAIDGAYPIWIYINWN